MNSENFGCFKQKELPYKSKMHKQKRAQTAITEKQTKTQKLPEKAKPFRAQVDDNFCHRLGRLLRKSADKANRGENCT